MKSTELVWIGRDNPTVRQLYADAVPLDLTDATRYTLRVGDALLDSALDASTFQANSSTLTMLIGRANNLSQGVHQATLTIYSPAYPNGLNIEPFAVDVRA